MTPTWSASSASTLSLRHPRSIRQSNRRITQPQRASHNNSVPWLTKHFSHPPFSPNSDPDIATIWMITKTESTPSTLKTFRFCQMVIFDNRPGPLYHQSRTMDWPTKCRKEPQSLQTWGQGQQQQPQHEQSRNPPHQASTFNTFLTVWTIFHIDFYIWTKVCAPITPITPICVFETSHFRLYSSTAVIRTFTHLIRLGIWRSDCLFFLPIRALLVWDAVRVPVSGGSSSSSSV